MTIRADRDRPPGGLDRALGIILVAGPGGQGEEQGASPPSIPASYGEPGGMAEYAALKSVTAVRSPVSRRSRLRTPRPWLSFASARHAADRRQACRREPVSAARSPGRLGLDRERGCGHGASSSRVPRIPAEPAGRRPPRCRLPPPVPAAFPRLGHRCPRRSRAVPGAVAGGKAEVAEHPGRFGSSEERRQGLLLLADGAVQQAEISRSQVAGQACAGGVS